MYNHKQSKGKFMKKKNSIFKSFINEFLLIGKNIKNFLSKPANLVFLFGMITFLGIWGYFLFISFRFDFLNKINQSGVYCRDLDNSQILKLIFIVVTFMLSTVFSIGEFVNYLSAKTNYDKKIFLRNSLITFCSSFSVFLLGLYFLKKWC